MYHEPWATRKNLGSTGNMVEIEPKRALKLDYGSIPRVLAHATKVSERRPGLIMTHATQGFTVMAPFLNPIIGNREC